MKSIRYFFEYIFIIILFGLLKVLGYKTMAFIGIYLDKAIRNPEAVKQLEKIPEVIECHYTTGDWSILIKILCEDNQHLMNVLN